ncbi:hypothetical protein BN946_scf184768.g8 [Trametes cinnabarina]|uniref:Uncharacterized protein n=1 Tax=Pycnoporus cinnabarinus TaxID=5643 RepID=A0A060SP30_PYCCI|nr:hypothetical protein BN946_scf184768.g8 [Trametes cinnabarina]
MYTAFTISGDATTHRKINLEARHMAVRAPVSYSSVSPSESSSLRPPLLDVTPQQRLLGIESSPDHTSESQVRGWKKKLTSVTTAFNQSPLARRAGETISVEDTVMKLSGMGGDHAADQLKTTNLIETWKKDITHLVLGRDHLHENLDSPASLSTLGRLLQHAAASAVSIAGGGTAWAALPADVQMASMVESTKQATMDLGRDLYEALPDEEKRPLNLFLRVGCTMHKDLNSVKGGNAAMMAAWTDLELKPPILLANKENASALRDIDVDAVIGASSLLLNEDLTAAELRALESSARGAVKLTSLAGALFNHKDSKKGHHDTYNFYFREVTHCTAAAELLVHHQQYLNFLVIIRDRKERPGFNHLEENVYKGLQDIPTLTELAALTLYAQAITHPYMRIARSSQNGLKLGPLHDKLQCHIQVLIDHPELLLGDAADYRKATLDGKLWERPEAVETVHKMAQNFPHLRQIFVAFLQGALTTWGRFSQEFAKGGAIDCATEAELDTAWVSSTNDHNEGALGSRCSWSHSRPNASEAYYNAQAKYHSNATEDFIQAHLHLPEDQQHLRAVARSLDSSGHESIRRQEQGVHAVTQAAQGARAREERDRKAEEARVKVEATILILDSGMLEKLTRDQMEEQLEVYRKLENDKEVPLKSKIPTRAAKLDTLRNALTRYQVRQSTLP